MRLAPREAALGLCTAAVALIAVTMIIATPKIDKWKELRQERVNILKQIERDGRLLNEKANWDREYAKLSKMMPAFPYDQKMDVHWLSVMDDIAAKNGVKISTRQVGEEKKQGDVYELPIECKEWEGTLDAIAHFLFDMQSAGAMLDIRQLLVKPQGKGILRGRFTLYCAYMREGQKGK